MNRGAFIIIWLFFTVFAYGQVGINTTDPDPAAILDIQSEDKGVLIPRVDIENLNDINPITGGSPVGLLVYNTNTSIGEGFYYWTGTQWSTVDGGRNWGVQGNTGTLAANNFIGTTDNQALVFKTNNVETMRVTSNGEVVVNGTLPDYEGDKLTVYGNPTEYAINGYSNTGTAIYGENSGLGYGVYGVSNNVGIFGYGAYGLIAESSINAGQGVRAINSGASGTGLLAAGNNSPLYVLTNGSGAALNGISYGAVAYGNHSVNGWGIVAAGNDLSTYTITGGGGGSFTGYQWGVYANATVTGPGNNGTNRAAFVGSYISHNNNVANVYVGARIGGTPYKILGQEGASVSTTMQTRDGERILFAPEATENWFFDMGEVQLVNGKATVELDPLFVDCISDSKPFKVFVQGAEETMGSIRISRNQDAKTFVLEDMGGPSNGIVMFSVYGIWRGKEDLRLPIFSVEETKRIQYQEKIEVSNSNIVTDIKKTKDNKN